MFVNILYFRFIIFYMPTKKEVLALRWAEKSEEEKNLIRKKNAEQVRLCRARKGVKKRSEMNAEELSSVREKDKIKKRIQKINMTDEQKDKLREKDRDRKAKDRNNKISKESKEHKSREDRQIELTKLKGKKIKQMLTNCKTQEKIRANRTEEEEEDIQLEEAIIMREKRSRMTVATKKLARIYAKHGMREHRRFGYLREYKQRKRRDHFDPESWEKEPHPVSEYFKKVKESETDLERKQELKRKNRIRVQKHRMKVNKMLQEPVIIKDYGLKGEYELLRERNIQEFEILKKKSGLFD